MKQLIVFFLVCLLSSCFRSKKDHKYTYSLCKTRHKDCACNLFVEGYLSFGMGALGSDVYSEYLTDSSGFRIYIGEYDEYDEKLVYSCVGDSVYVEKRTNKGYARDDWATFKVVEKGRYSLEDLRKGHSIK